MLLTFVVFLLNCHIPLSHSFILHGTFSEMVTYFAMQIVYFANIVHVVENSIPLLYRCAFFPRNWWRIVYLFYTAVLSSRGHVIPTIKQLTVAYHCDPHLQLPAIRLQIYTQKCVKHTSAADPDSHNCVSCKGFSSQVDRST